VELIENHIRGEIKPTSDDLELVLIVGDVFEILGSWRRVYAARAIQVKIFPVKGRGDMEMGRSKERP
jgi:hypothetical protein